MNPLPPSLTPRDRLVHAIQTYPGLHTRELARRAGMSEALAAYHLNLMTLEGVAEVAEDGLFRRYYLPGQRVAAEDRAWMAFLRRPAVLHMTLFILQRGPTTHAELTEELDLAKSTISYHTSLLLEAGYLRRAGEDADRLALTDRRRVERILARWVPTPDLADRFAQLFGRFYAPRTRKSK